MQTYSPAASIASTSATTSTTDKPKRKQYTSCDACRVRKVKCLMNEGAVICNGCLSKNIKCTTQFASENHSGKGKRLDLARRTFGTGSLNPKARPPPSMGDPSMHSLQTRLGSAMLSASALYTFLDLYATRVQPILPNTDIVRLRDVCATANFNLGELDALDQILCLCTIGLTAKIGDLKHSPFPNMDVRTVGHNMVQQALSESDRCALQRQPSYRGTQALSLLLQLTAGEDITGGKRSTSYRSLQASFVEHLRERADGSLTPSQTTGFFLAHFVSDSFASAISGQPPAFSNEDVEEYAPILGHSTEEILATIQNVERASGEVGWPVMAGTLCQIARQIYRSLNSRKAKQRDTLDIAAIYSILQDLQSAKTVGQVYQFRIQLIYGENWPMYLRGIAHMSSFLVTVILTIILNETEEAIIKESLGQARPPYLQQLSTLFAIAQAQLMAETFITYDAFELTTQKIFGAADGLLAYQTVARLNRILTFPTNDHDPHSAWSRDDKARSARFYLKLCQAVGEQFPEVEREIPFLQKQVDALSLPASTSPPSITSDTPSASLESLPRDLPSSSLDELLASYHDLGREAGTLI